jgi:hypothetical protein
VDDGADDALLELELELEMYTVERVDVRIVLALALVLGLTLDVEDDAMALDLVEEVVDEQLDTAVLWHMPMLGMRAAPVLCNRESVP